MLSELNPEKLRERGRRPGAFEVKLGRGMGEACVGGFGLLSSPLSFFSAGEDKVTEPGLVAGLIADLIELENEEKLRRGGL